MKLLGALAAAAAVVCAAPLDARSGPSVSIKDGTVVGSSGSGVDSFKGIPFAQPPIGNLRLKPPQRLTSGFGTLDATAVPPSCPQFIFSVEDTNLPTNVIGILQDTPFGQAITHASEDCLTINVQRPATATANSKLPVLVWIYGGGFEFGGTLTYDGAGIVQKSVDMGKPVIYVAMNYRVGGFGFLAGKQLQKDGSTNLGLRDQRLALEWVHDNIAAFGGDPSQVTIWGESAGAISVFDHTVINGGNNTYKNAPLFRGAIMNSGSVVPAQEVSHPKAQAIYDTVVAEAGCSTASDSLACLRNADYETFLNAANSVPSIISYESLDLSYLPRPDPSDNFFATSPEMAVYNGAFAKVPIIIGDQQDEGTLFALLQSNLTTTKDVIDYLQTYFPSATRQQIAGVVNLYPDDPSAGSPYNTGPLYNLYPQQKRLASILGDLTFTLSRRIYLATVAQSVPAWSYLATFYSALPVLGTFHATDIAAIYFGLAPQPRDTYLGYYISFVNALDPNALAKQTGLLAWPKWAGADPELVRIGFTQNSIIKDDFRSSVSQYLTGKTQYFRA